MRAIFEGHETRHGRHFEVVTLEPRAKSSNSAQFFNRLGVKMSRCEGVMYAFFLSSRHSLLWEPELTGVLIFFYFF